MDLKSSSLEFCKQEAIAVPSAKVRLSSGWTLAFRASASRCIARFGLIALISLLPTAAVVGQTAEKAFSKVDLGVTTIEGPARTQATFTVKVAGTGEASSATPPTGSVSFMTGDRSIGSVLLDSSGQATYTSDQLPIGTQQVTAVYQGDSSHQTAISAPESVKAQSSGTPGFTLSASATSLTTPAGGTATTVITATPSNGFNQAVSLSCSGVPYATVTCIFSPATVTPGAPTAAAPNGTPVLSTLSIQTIAPSGAELRDPDHKVKTAYAIVLPGILALAGLGLARRRTYGRMRMVGLVALMLAGGLGLGACSQRYNYYHKPPAGNPGTTTGTYAVLVSGLTGTGSTLTTATVPLTLTVTAAKN